MTNDFLLAIPVFNEQASIARVVRKARIFCPDCLVVDDGSTDGTGDVLRTLPGIRVLTHPENRGYGKSLADAFAYARCQSYRWLITIDADEQHEVEHIPGFIEEANKDQADIISGTRYPDGWVADPTVPADRREINRLVTTTLNRRLGLGITDAFCGFKAYRVSALDKLSISVPGYAMPMQLWVQAWRAGLRIVELSVPLVYLDPTRHFGGLLDDPNARLQHYLSVLEAELIAPRLRPGHVAPCAG